MPVTRKRSRVIFPAVLLTMRRRIESVPKVALFAGSAVRSLMRFGDTVAATVVSAKSVGNAREMGTLKFSGPGPPSLEGTPSNVPPFVDKNRKSAELLVVSDGAPAPLGMFLTKVNSPL